VEGLRPSTQAALDVEGNARARSRCVAFGCHFHQLLRTVTATGGAAIQAVAAQLLVERSSFEHCGSHGPGGALWLKRTDTTLRGAHFVGNYATLGPRSTPGAGNGGAIFMEGGALFVEGSSFVLNHISLAEDPKLVSWVAGEGESIKLQSAQGAGVAAWSIVNTPFQPYDDAGERNTVVTSGVGLAGCAQYPCAAGQMCSYEHYSLDCSACPLGLVSTDGVTCTVCPAGMQAAADQTGCEPCVEGFSSKGTCGPCPSGFEPLLPSREECRQSDLCADTIADCANILLTFACGHDLSHHEDVPAGSTVEDVCPMQCTAACLAGSVSPGLASSPAVGERPAVPSDVYASPWGEHPGQIIPGAFATGWRVSRV
jgi:hypothetical protein